MQTAGQIAMLRLRLLEWYRACRRDLPWRRTSDPYPIWLAETMLQQTRVAAVLPYYERFLERFPSPAALAAAPEAEILAMWAGLGYYSRARNLHKAAIQIHDAGAFPGSLDAIRALPGVGDYTAAAVGSIAFHIPIVVVDGNVLRVIARLTGDSGDIGSQITRRRIRNHAQTLLDPRCPGDFNQALMELGATLCLPRDPQCGRCPWEHVCEAHARGIERELPVKLRKQTLRREHRTIAIAERNGSLLLRQRGPGDSLMPGFWELPELHELGGDVRAEIIGRFRHSITVHDYHCDVVKSEVVSRPAGFRWVNRKRLETIPLSTVARKALALRARALDNK
ncbi:MAG: A/G-specific adenine glycosylase [Bryobacteraceae bacterium]